jgi:hypothetical protein
VRNPLIQAESRPVVVAEAGGKKPLGELNCESESEKFILFAGNDNRKKKYLKTESLAVRETR